MTEKPASKRRGCFFYGCLTSVILFLLGGISIFLAVHYALNKLVNDYTDNSPTPLPRVQISAEEWDKLQKRIANFKEAVEARKPTEPLVLSASDLNALIAKDPGWAEMKDKLYVEIESNRISGKVSIPLEKLGLRRLKGRYLNGAAVLGVALTNGVLAATIDSLEVKRKPVPARFMTELRKINLSEETGRNPKIADTMRKLESIEVSDGQITIKPRTEN